ncbi:polyphenol oxidase family protein [Pantoea sp. C2G6]|uniref:polyphenol oxidase family protein n=1 Tax=Pantoea sp. C2G6 TaxID=3243084 RepID=UPI003ED9AF02
MAVTPRSSLLDSLEWLDYAFQAAGAPPPADAAYGHQRHSATVVTDVENWPPKSVESDGIIATGSRPVAVYTADCLPVLFADRQRKTVAAVHAGLKGTLAGVLIRAVEKLCEQGSDPQQLCVAIGPAMGPCCYELAGPQLAEMEQRADLAGWLRWHHNQPVNPLAQRPQATARQQGVWFDLPALATRMLIAAGVPAAQIDNLNLCTYCMAEPGSSYRFNTHFSSGYHSRYSWIRRR